MAWVFEKSPTWRRIVARTKESPGFYATFAAACFVAPYGLGKAVMWATNPETARKRDMALQAELKGRQTYHHEVTALFGIVDTKLAFKHCFRMICINFCSNCPT